MQENDATLKIAYSYNDNVASFSYHPKFCLVYSTPFCSNPFQTFKETPVVTEKLISVADSVSNIKNQPVTQNFVHVAKTVSY